MTVSSVTPVNNYTGNSSNTKFDFDFLIENSNELTVQHTDSDGIITVLTEGTDYSINEIGNKEGSYITFPLHGSNYDVLSSDETISLMLDLTIKQEAQFGNSLYFDLHILERTFDYIVRILQIFSRKFERCVKVNEGSGITPTQLLTSIKESEVSAAASATNAATSEGCALSYLNATYAAKNEAIAAIDDEKTAAISQITPYLNLAQQWATKTDDKVDGNEYSAKYYAGLSHRNQAISYEQMRSADAYLNEGAVLSDEEGYSSVRTMKVSSFDLSKFSVTGTPTITVDGIASGFSGSNYFTGNVIDFSHSSNVKIEGAFITPTVLPSRASWVYSLTQNNGTADDFIGLAVNTNGKIGGGLQVSNTSYGFGSTDYVCATNTIYKFEYNLVWNGVSTFKLTDENGTVLETRTKTGIPVWQNDLCPFIGVARWALNNSAYTGSVDLTKFKVTIDGIPVFSADKTCIDTIKTDDYAVVGTPTISADGIASGFSSSNYITLPQHSITERFKIKRLRFKPGTSNGNQTLLIWGPYSNANNFRVFVNDTGKYLVLISSDGSNEQLRESVILNQNQWNTIDLIYEGEELFVYVNNKLRASFSVALDLSFCTQTPRIGYAGGDANRIFNGEIDMNFFVEYDENYKYFPSLKIPYTESVTGSKIVNAAYRDRVYSCYEVNGYAPYFTIDEVNETFTMPMGEINGSTDKKIAKLEAATNSALALKLNKTLSDITSDGKSEIIDCLMPDRDNAVTLLTGQTGAGTYTCPDNGYIVYVGLTGYAGSNSLVKVNDALIVNVVGATGMQSGSGIYIVEKNDVVDYSVPYHYLPENIAIYFVPMKGV